MPQPKSSSGRSSAKQSSAKQSSSKQGSKTRGSSRSARAGGGGSGAGSSRSDDARIAQLRELLGQAVVIPAERLQAVLDDARQRGHIDAKGVEDIAHGLLRQAEDVRRDLEELLGRGVANVEEVVSRATEGARAAGRRAAEAGEPLLRAVGRGERTQTQEAKRAASSSRTRGGGAGASGRGGSSGKGGGASASSRSGGARKGGASASARSGGTGKGRGASGSGGKGGGGAGRGLPIAGYDDLKAAEIVAKLDGLTAAQLRKVRKHEEQGSSRKTILQAVDRKLG